MPILEELKRRNVFRVGIAYLITAWLLAQILELLLENFGAPEWVMKTLLVVMAAGFPLALIFAWAFEMTPEGIRRERDVSETASITAQTGRKLDRAIIVILALALAWFAWDRHRLQQTAAPVSVVEQTTAEPAADTEAEQGIPVIAVLPFKATGSDDGGFLASGLHDDLLTRLAKLGAFKVISRTSMMEYADRTRNMRQIGRELGAGYILEGGVQAMGGRVRINAQLIDADADEHLWAEIYDHELTAENLFDVQAELAVAIADALHTELSPSDRALVSDVPTRNMAAYNAYLLGRQKSESVGWIGTQKGREAVEAFEEAVRLDPDFALAWALLSSARIRDACCKFTAEQGEGALAALARARALQPGMLESELAWAEYLYRFLNEYEQALDALAALGDRLEGNPEGLQLKAFLNRRLGRFESGYRLLQAALILEPRNPSIHLNLVYFAWQKDDCESAGKHVEQLKSLAGDEPEARVSIADYELECNGNARAALGLVSDIDFSLSGGWTSAWWAAWVSRDTQLALALNETPNIFTSRGDMIWKPLNRASIYRHLEPDETRLAIEIEDAASMLEALEGDSDDAQNAQIASQKFWLHALKGDAEETRRWIGEHKRRFSRQAKGDVFQERTHLLNYAQAFVGAGLAPEAIAELRAMLEAPGGHRFPLVDLLPEFDALKDHPGYAELRERFGDNP